MSAARPRPNADESLVQDVPPTAIEEAERPRSANPFPTLVSWPGMALICWVMTSLVGAIGLSGWLAGPRSFAGFGYGLVPIAPSEASLLILMGFSMVFYVYAPSRRFAKPTVAAAMTFTWLFSVLKLTEYAGGAWFNIEHLFVRHLDSWGGRFVVGAMSPVCAALFTALSTALFLLVVVVDRRQHAIRAASVLSALCLLMALACLGAYVVGGTPVDLGTRMPVSVAASMGFLFLGLGTLIGIGPAHYPLKILVKNRS